MCQSIVFDFQKMNLLLVLLGVNSLTLLFLLFSQDWRIAKITSLLSSFLQLIVFLLIWLNFDFTSGLLQYNLFFLPFNESTFSVHLAVDGLSLYFIFLTVLLLPVCILCSWSTIVTRVAEFQLLLQVTTLLLLLVFTVQDLLLFYVSFEAILIPMFLIVGVWGSRDRKIHAAYQFFMYTLVGSVLMLIAILYLYNRLGSTHIFVLLDSQLECTVGRLLWFALFISFAVKVPMIPFHIWLPEAHVEAPTAGSVILAGILLKMGTYGLIKFSLPIFPEATLYFQPIVYLFSLIGVVYSALTTIRQVDLKKIIAYSSVGHMNYVTLGIASGSLAGLEGSLFMMLGHGFVSSALFLCVGGLYERYHTRVLLYYGGLVLGMPLFASFFLFFTLANVSFPGTSNFIGELFILLGVFTDSQLSALLAASGVILSAVYAFWLYNRLVFGLVKVQHISAFSDLNSREVLVMMVFGFLVLWAGLLPNVFLEAFHFPVLLVLDRLY
jgi:NADH-quinone oxidoreductase subunit M